MDTKRGGGVEEEWGGALREGGEQLWGRWGSSVKRRIASKRDSEEQIGS